MVAPSDLIPDAEVVASAWLKTNADLASDLFDVGPGTWRIATNVPELPVFPFVVITRIGGSMGVDTEAPIEEALMQFDAFAAKGDKRPDLRTASRVARQIAHYAHEAGSVAVSLPLGDAATVYGMELFSGPRRLLEPDLQWARYTVDMTMVYKRS